MALYFLTISLSIYAPQSRLSIPGFSAKDLPDTSSHAGADTALQQVGNNFAAECLFSRFTMLYSGYFVLRRVTEFMAIYNLNGLLDKYNGEFLILEFNHLFISSTIREEVWLLQRKNDPSLLEDIMQAAREFDIHEVSEDRDFETYSGGQKAILACLLTMTLVGARKIHGLKLLLNNILDSISAENRSKLMGKFKEFCSTRDIALFTEKNGHIQEII